MLKFKMRLAVAFISSDTRILASLVSVGMFTPPAILLCWVQVLCTADPEQKAQQTHRAWQQHMRKRLKTGLAVPPDSPARPSLPEVGRMQGGEPLMLGCRVGQSGKEASLCHEHDLRPRHDMMCLLTGGWSWPTQA